MFRLTPRGLDATDVDSTRLRRYIETNVSNELSKMSGDCYYPKISQLYKELLHMTNNDDKSLKEYAKSKWGHFKRKDKKMFYLLADPYTTLLILITQYFLNEKSDLTGAMWAYNLFALRYYSNLMHRYLPQGCNPDYWKSALERLSHSHLFRTKDTIGNSVMYLGKQTFKRYEKAMKRDDVDEMAKMIQEVRSRINQSMRSFFRHYYAAKEDKETISTTKGDETGEDTATLEKKKRQFAESVSKDMCVYRKHNNKALEEARQVTKFNRDYAQKYAKAMANPEYQEMIELIISLMLRPLTEMKMICTTKFIEHLQKLMSVKTSRQPVYFKKSIIELHDGYIIPAVGLDDWFASKTLQTKKMSRDLVAYYIAFFTRSYLC